MTDTPISGNVTEAMITSIVLQLPSDAANKFGQLLLDLRALMKSMNPPGAQVEMLWNTSILVPGAVAINVWCECLIQLQAYANAHGGDPTGFSYPSLVVPPWWKGKVTPFKVHAKNPCRIWKIPNDTDIHQDLAKTPPFTTITDPLYEMDVSEVVLPFATEPAWFKVYQKSPIKEVCLADECEPI